MLSEMSPVQSSEDGILTKLYRQMLVETGFINSINYFINRYKGKKSRTTVGRLILNGEMTWNSFTFLILTILKARYISLSLSFTDNDEEKVLSIKIEHNDYIEKKSGKYLKDLFDKVCDRLGLNESDLKDRTTKYYKSGGKKNKATISNILGSEIISWKSFMFLVFELLTLKDIKFILTIKAVHGKVTDHELAVERN